LRRSWPAFALALGAVLVAVAAALYILPSDEYIFLPDRARPLAPLVRAQGERPDTNGGGIYYVAVDVRKASVLEKVFPALNEGATLVPENQVRPKGVDERARRQGELQQMARSQQYAAAVALRALGRTVTVTPHGALVEGVGDGYPASGKLRANDVIVALDGKSIRRATYLTTLLAKRKPGSTVRLEVRRAGQRTQITIRTTRSPSDPNRAFLGIVIADDADVTLPIEVKFDLGNVGGPSAGLAFALDLVDELGRDVDHGRRIAATGEILLDGSVHEIGGVKQKTIAARRSGMDLFLVPGENAAEARQYGGGLRILPVDSFQQALRALATTA